MARKKAFYRKILLSPYLLAMLVSVPFIIFFLLVLNKFTVNTVSTNFTSKTDEVNFWADVNGDGDYEQIQTFHNRAGKAAVTIRNKYNDALGQWNLRSRFHREHQCREVLLDDLDGDSLPDIALLSQDSNRIYLDVIRPSDNSKIWLEHIFIDSVHIMDGTFDYAIIMYPQAVKFAPDQPLHILFTISGGFSRIPRKLYAFNMNDHSLKRSVNLNSCNVTQVVDINHDGMKEILISNSSPANDTMDDAPFPNDHSSYLTVFDDELRFVFPPVRLGGKHSSTIEFYSQTSDHLIALVEENAGRGPKQKLMYFTDKGELVYDTVWETSANEALGFYGGKRLLLMNRGRIFAFAHDFVLKPVSDHFTKSITLIPTRGYPVHLKHKLIAGYYKNTQKLFLTDDQFSHFINLDVPVNFYSAFTLYRIQDIDQQMQFALQTGDELHKLAVSPSFAYRFRFLIIGLIYFSILSFILLIRHLQRIQFERRLEEERKLMAIKTRALSNHVDPHFTLNALNAIAGMISHNSPERAYHFLVKFSRLIHSVLSRSDELFTTIGQELEFVKDYLDLQQLRFPGLFEYTIHMDENIRPRQIIPKMIIQTFAENAVKHGLRSLDRGGKLKISLTSQNKSIRVVISDNGIGREAAAKMHSTDTGIGLKVVQQMVDILKYYSREPLTYSITDLNNGQGKSSGTRIEVIIPEYRQVSRIFN